LDLPTWARAIWRFKWIFYCGLVLACLLAVLATARVSFGGGKPTLTYRTPVIYTTQTKLFVTQAGFPWGRTVLPGSAADPTRFVFLAGIYATLANSNQIQTRLVNPGKSEALTASAEVDSQTQTALPVIDLISFAPSPRRAVEMAGQATSMLQQYVEAQQKSASIPANQRVLLQALPQRYKVTIATGRKKTVPIVVFMTVLLATIGLILALENIRPRIRRGEIEELTAVRADEARESSASRRAG
jgi:hypothetical protein